MQCWLGGTRRIRYLLLLSVLMLGWIGRWKSPSMTAAVGLLEIEAAIASAVAVVAVLVIVIAAAFVLTQPDSKHSASV